MKHKRNWKPLYLRKNNEQHAFTLLEVMIALGLFVILLSILWNVIALFTRSQTRGSMLAERSQLVRSLAQLLEDDLRAAIQDPIHPLKAGSGGDDDVRRFSLSGNEQSLRIDVIEINPFAQTETEPRVAQFGVISPSQPKAAELKTVFYLFNRAEGLLRREIDFETPDMNSPGPEGSRLSAPEIVSCRFRYFDGTSWSSSWESLQRNGLPIAIEADLQSVSLADSVKLRRLQQNSPTGSIDETLKQLELPAPVQQRIVVYLPASPVRKFEDYKRRTPPKKANDFPPPPPPVLTLPPSPSVDIPQSVPEPAGTQETWIRGK